MTVHRDQVFKNNQLVSETVWDTTAATVTTFANGSQTGTRAMTADEVAAYTVNDNKRAIQTNLTQDMAAMQTIIDTANATINSSPAAHIKNIARNLKRLDRIALQDFTAAD